MNLKPSMSSRAVVARASLREVGRELVHLEGRVLALEKDMRRPLEAVAAHQRASARNLVHYLALRQHDLRDLQSQLSQHGLSSLGRSESCVLGSILEVSQRTQEALAFDDAHRGKTERSRLEKAGGLAMSWEAANKLLHEHTRDILGPRPEDRHIYIMVTAPSAKEADRAWMVKMLVAGMNVLRINCAHEGESEWRRLVQALQAAKSETRKTCRVLMDLAGPKIRTGPIAGPGEALTWKPAKDKLGKVLAPARVVIRRASAPVDADAGPYLRMRDRMFKLIRTGDELRLRDARGKKRVLVISAVEPDQVLGLAMKRAYVLGEGHARLIRAGAHVGDVVIDVGNAAGAAIDVRTGDTVVLGRKAPEGKPPRRDGKGDVEEPGVVGCTLPAALDHLAVGHRVLFDDGRIDAIVERADTRRGEYLLRVLRTQKETVKLRAEKGINLPDTLTTVPSLTAEDRRALPFVAKHADAVSLSFVRRPEDVRALHAALERLGRATIGVVLKIETRAGFENLSRLLLEGLRRPPLAIMIARGDLAVEVGFERLAELQEEILWLCEAAHVPAIWATQVLDTLARTGVPSRAEVTDAAASVAAECVMLNKGPFVDEAVRVLANILRRMEKHHYKKRSLFRKLKVSTSAEVDAR